jgi:hypothetical protein
LHNTTADERLADTPVTVQMDGVTHTVPAGSAVVFTNAHGNHCAVTSPE